MMQKSTNSLSVRLRAVRKSLDLTQQTLSERIGVSRAYIADVEAGRKDPSRNFIVKLTEKINISGDWFLSGIGRMFLDGTRGTIRDRLVEMLSATERDVDSWMILMGIDSKYVTQEENLETHYEALFLRAQYQEGFRREWLMQGLGTPFPGGRFRSDTDAKGRLDLLLTWDKGWHIYLVTDRDVFGVLLIAPTWTEIDDAQSYEYTVMEVIGGAVGRRTLAAIRKLLGNYAIYIVIMETSNLWRLVDGWMGTYELMGRGKVVGLLDGAIKIEHSAQVDEYIPEPVARIDPVELEKVCALAAEDPQCARILYWLSGWLPHADPEDRVYLEGLLKRNFPEFGEPLQHEES